MSLHFNVAKCASLHIDGRQKSRVLDSTLTIQGQLPQLHEARAPRGKVLPPPPPGQPKAKGKVAWVRAPMQPLPQLGYNTRTMPVLKPKTKNLQQPRPAYLATMPHGAHDLSPPVDQPYKPKTTLIVTKDYVRELV
ncbi:hypothetical protein Y1Q_0004435 [Alligator mississippiensis]|uniref:Uncharacterized protein n=1 Tax=Alligator mississippiensis TaxID=8496 RepID=A0A151NSV6_ALLMI|nr:hypothetical protein Y1Q_0004435 [Alligator mississippiensis]